MKIICPSCKTAYTIEESKIPEKGLVVKCSVCQTEYKVRKKSDVSQEAPKPIASTALDDLFNDFKGSAEDSDDEKTRNVKMFEKTDGETDIFEKTSVEDSLFSDIPSSSQKIDIEGHF